MSFKHFLMDELGDKIRENDILKKRVGDLENGSKPRRADVEVIYPILYEQLTDAEQTILQRLYGDLIGVQALAEELSLPEAQIIKLANQVWLKLDITTKQQLLEVWRGEEG